MRKLKTSDIFKASKIIKKMNLKLDIQEKMTQHEAGIYIIKQFAENLHMAEKEVSEFMGDLIGISAEEFSDMGLTESFQHFEELKNQEDIQSFFTLASKSIQ